MKKHLKVIFVLTIYCLLFCSDHVFASILDYETIASPGSFVEVNDGLTKIGNDSIRFDVNTDFTTDSFSDDKEYVIFRVYEDIYYLYTNYYSENWTDQDTVLLQSTTATSTTSPSSYTAGQIACKIQHNYNSTTATTTAMSCNYLGKNYIMELQNKSHYREHEYDYEQVNSTIIYRVRFSNNSTRNCEYENGYLVCPNIKGQTIKTIFMVNYNTNNNLFFKIKIDTGFGFYNKIQENQFNQIMNNDSSSFNTGIENIAGNTHLPNNSGLFDVLSSLSQFLGNLSVSGSCSPINVPIPFTNDSLRLPCMTTEVYAPNFPEVLAIWQLIVRGVVYYYIIVNFLKLLKDTIDPFSMKLEVLDL